MRRSVFLLFLVIFTFGCGGRKSSGPQPVDINSLDETLKAKATSAIEEIAGSFAFISEKEFSPNLLESSTSELEIALQSGITSVFPKFPQALSPSIKEIAQKISSDNVATDLVSPKITLTFRNMNSLLAESASTVEKYKDLIKSISPRWLLNCKNEGKLKVPEYCSADEEKFLCGETQFVGCKLGDYLVSGTAYVFSSLSQINLTGFLKLHKLDQEWSKVLSGNISWRENEGKSEFEAYFDYLLDFEDNLSLSSGKFLHSQSLDAISFEVKNLTISNGSLQYVVSGTVVANNGEEEFKFSSNIIVMQKNLTYSADFFYSLILNKGEKYLWKDWGMSFDFQDGITSLWLKAQKWKKIQRSAQYNKSAATYMVESVVMLDDEASARWYDYNVTLAQPAKGKFTVDGMGGITIVEKKGQEQRDVIIDLRDVSFQDGCSIPRVGSKAISGTIESREERFRAQIKLQSECSCYGEAILDMYAPGETCSFFGCYPTGSWYRYEVVKAQKWDICSSGEKVKSKLFVDLPIVALTVDGGAE